VTVLASPTLRPCTRVPARIVTDDPGPPAALHDALTRAFRDLLAARGPAASVCPSEAARAVAPGDWRPLMDAARRAAGSLADRGEAEVTQRGRVVDVRTARGPVRVRLKAG